MGGRPRFPDYQINNPSYTSYLTQATNTQIAFQNKEAGDHGVLPGVVYLRSAGCHESATHACSWFLREASNEVRGARSERRHHFAVAPPGLKWYCERKPLRAAKYAVAFATAESSCPPPGIKAKIGRA